jgi:hypothetical protein
MIARVFGVLQKKNIYKNCQDNLTFSQIFKVVPHCPVTR